MSDAVYLWMNRDILIKNRRKYSNYFGRCKEQREDLKEKEEIWDSAFFSISLNYCL